LATLHYLARKIYLPNPKPMNEQQQKINLYFKTPIKIGSLTVEVISAGFAAWIITQEPEYRDTTGLREHLYSIETLAESGKHELEIETLLEIANKNDIAYIRLENI